MAQAAGDVEPGNPPADPEDLPLVRVFISSPGDVQAERHVALSVIRRLQGWFQGRLVLVPVLWEQEPLLATAGFQEEIDRRAAPSATDVAIFILWSRLGTPLSEDFTLDDGRLPTGTEWEFEDACAASQERRLPHILVYRKTSPPKVEVTASDLEARRSNFEAVEAFFQRQFVDSADLSFTGSFHAFPATSAFGHLLEQHLLKVLSEHLTGDASRITWHESPFRGLEVFEAKHAPIFFGRTQAIQEVRQALATQVEDDRAFVLILGRSGDGKSSLARAGLMPMLQVPWVVDETLTGGLCRQAVMHPGSGTSPLNALVEALCAEDALPALADHGSPDDLARVFAESPRAAVSHVHGALKQACGGGDADCGRLVLLVDQLEELFAAKRVSAESRAAFVNVLDALARSGDVWVLATLRSDFYPAFTRESVLMALKDGAGHYDLGPPDSAEIAQIIRGPAQVAGLEFETDPMSGRGLDDILIADAGAGPDALPLLEYTLTLLEKARDGGTLGLQAYADLGGIEGAISTRAEHSWQGLPEEARQAFPGVLRALVDVSGLVDSSVTHRRTPWSEVAITPGAEVFLREFVEARLLVASGDGKNATVAVAHEALLRSWPRAAKQIGEEKELLLIRSRVRTQAARWRSRAKDRSLLLTPGRPLEEARLLGKAGFVLTREEADYLSASEFCARRQGRVRMLVMISIGVLALAATVLAVVAREHADQAEAAQARAEAGQQTAERLLRFMVGDMQEGLEPIGRLDLLTRLGEEARSYYGGLSKATMTPEGLRDGADALRKLGEAHQARGELQEARSAFEESLNFAMALGETGGKSGGAALHVSQALGRLARVDVEQGYPTRAIERLGEGTDAMKAIGETHPDAREHDAARAYAHFTLGRAHLRRADWPQARSQFERARQIGESLRDGDDVSGSAHRTLVRYLLAAWHTARVAETAKRTALADEARQIVTTWVRQRPRDVRWEVCEIQVRDALCPREPGTDEELREAHSRLVDVRRDVEGLRQSDRENATYLAWIARLEMRLGDLAWRRQMLEDVASKAEGEGRERDNAPRPTERVKHMVAALGILRGLADADPTNMIWASDVVRICHMLAELPASDGINADDALEYREEALEFSRRCSLPDQSIVQLQLGHAWSIEKLASANRMTNPGKAGELWAEVIEICHREAARHPEWPLNFAFLEADAAADLAKLEQERDHQAERVAILRRSLAFLGTSHQIAPRDWELTGKIVAQMNRLAIALAENGTDGADGTDGTAGTAGTAGTDGTDGTDGADRADRAEEARSTIRDAFAVVDAYEQTGPEDPDVVTAVTAWREMLGKTRDTLPKAPQGR